MVLLFSTYLRHRANRSYSNPSQTRVRGGEDVEEYDGDPDCIVIWM